MNICLLTSTFLPIIGGKEIVVHNLATALTDLGHKVFVLTPRPTKRKVIDNYPYKVIRFGFKGYGRLKLPFTLAVSTLAYVVKCKKIDLIHVHNVFTPGSWAFYYGKFNQKIPIVGTPHGDDVQIDPDLQYGVRMNPQFDTIVRRNLNAFKYVTAISPSFGNDLQKLLTDKTKIIDIPNGVWVKNYQQKIDVAMVRKKYGIPTKCVAVISVGRNHPVKGFEYGIKALSLLKKAGVNVVYILVGRNMEPIIQTAKQLNVSDLLITPGQVDAEAIAQLLQSSDIYLSTSIVESFGLTTLEAMSAGLPCVVTDITGSRDLVSPNHGFLVKVGKPHKIAEALKWLIKNPSARKDMGNNAKMEAIKYDWQNIAGRYVDVYETCLKYQ